MKNLITKTRTSQANIVERYLNNPNYFSKANKRFFNVHETKCYEIGNSFGAIIEKQGEFLPDGENHTSLKLVSHDRNIITITSGFEGSRNGQNLFDDLIYFLKHNLGYYEKLVISKLKHISLTQDYRNTILFESHDNKGFYLCLEDDIRTILHK
jgi:hypothetical protein